MLTYGIFVILLQYLASNVKKYCLPFVRKWVEFTIELPHGDGLGVQDVGVDVFEGVAGRRHFAFQRRLGRLQNLVALKQQQSRDVQ